MARKFCVYCVFWGGPPAGCVRRGWLALEGVYLFGFYDVKCSYR